MTTILVHLTKFVYKTQPKYSVVLLARFGLLLQFLFSFRSMIALFEKNINIFTSYITEQKSCILVHKQNLES